MFVSKGSLEIFLDHFELIEVSLIGIYEDLPLFLHTKLRFRLATAQ